MASSRYCLFFAMPGFSFSPRRYPRSTILVRFRPLGRRLGSPGGDRGLSRLSTARRKKPKAVNVEGTRNVAAVAGRGRPVIFASTSSCYGMVEDSLCTEETPLRPVSLYGQQQSPGRGHHPRPVQCRRLSDSHRLWAVAAHAPGPAGHPISCIVLCTSGIYGFTKAQARRSFIHVADVARAILMALEKSSQMTGQVYNVGDESQNYTKLEICRLISQIIPGVTIQQCTEGQDLDRRNYLVSYQRIRGPGLSGVHFPGNGHPRALRPFAVDRPPRIVFQPPAGLMQCLSGQLHLKKIYRAGVFYLVSH